MAYVTSDERPEGCVFCLSEDTVGDRERLVLTRRDGVFAVLNRYPYTNGHVLVIPDAHVARPGALPPGVWAALAGLLEEVVDALEQAFGPDGVNVGMNLGHSAGAGITEHLHWHAVPRWTGDTNFMPVVANTKVIPQALDDTWAALAPLLRQTPGGST